MPQARRLDELKILESSGVDRPANQSDGWLVMKNSTTTGSAAQWQYIQGDTTFPLQPTTYPPGTIVITPSISTTGTGMVFDPKAQKPHPFQAKQDDEGNNTAVCATCGQTKGDGLHYRFQGKGTTVPKHPFQAGDSGVCAVCGQTRGASAHVADGGGMLDAPGMIGAAKATTKSDGGKKFPASDYAYVPDPEKPSTWKLRLTSTPGGAPDPAIVGAAAAALSPGGHRGSPVQIPSADRDAVKAKVRAAWKKANPDKSEADMPDSIQKKAYKADPKAPEGSVEEMMDDLQGVLGQLTPPQKAAAQALLTALSKQLKKGVLVPLDMESLDDDVRQHIEALQAQLDAAQSGGGGTAPPPAETTPPPAEGTPEPAEKAVASLQKQLEDAEKARQEEQRKAADLAERVAKMERKEREAEFVAKARDLPNLGGPNEVGHMLLSISEKVDEETYKGLERMLKAANAQLEKGALFGSIGTGAAEADSVEGKIEALAKAKLDAGQAPTIEQAKLQVIRENPEIRNEYRAR